MKKTVLVLLAIVVLVLIGCDDTTLTYSDFLGEWDFPGDVHVSVLESSPGSTEKQLDISWETDTHEYFAMAEGTAKRNLFTGTYDHNDTNKEDPYNPVFYDDNRTIRIKLTLKNKKLSVVCTGDSPLGGNTFTSGVKLPD